MSMGEMVVLIFWSQEQEMKSQDGRGTAPFHTPPRQPSLRPLGRAVRERTLFWMLEPEGLDEWKGSLAKAAAPK